MNMDANAPFDTHDMVLVHRALRRELKLMPDLVRGVDDSDTHRAEQVGAHAAMMLGFLGTHHEGEDELLWPLLLERAPSASDVVVRMQVAHDGIHTHLESIDQSLPTWRTTASAADGAALAETLGTLSSTLNAHLDDEEVAVLPLAVGHLSAQEWGELGRHGFAHVAPQDRLAILGGILEDADAAERETFLGNIDPMAARMWNTGGAEAYSGYMATVRGGVEPA